MKKRIGIFGWGLVAPRSPNIQAFETNLQEAGSWLKPFDGFGPSNFLVGYPEFRFDDYKEWVDQRFEPRRFAQLDEKMGNNVKYAIGAFIQALGQNDGLEELLRDLGPQAHVYVGTGLGDYAKQYEVIRKYEFARQQWNEFWCRDEHNPELARYRKASREEQERIRIEADLSADPEQMAPSDEGYLESRERWYRYWMECSPRLQEYLQESKAIEGENIGADIEATKAHVIRRKMANRRKLRGRYGAPEEPWNSVDANLLWNIANIPAAQISMLGKITGPALAPVAACSTFGTALWMASNAIQLGQAKAVVVGATDPEPHALSIGTFYNARVLAHDGQVCKPLTGLRGTHVAGGSCVWIVGDVDFMLEKGMTPLGLEILGVGVTSDADHIITPSKEGSRAAIELALEDAQLSAAEINTWDMHATATPGDWMELQNALELFPDIQLLTTRKGIFGHGMSVCGGWELTAQHMGVLQGRILPVNLVRDEIHPQIEPYAARLVGEAGVPVNAADTITGKINMGVGGINACVLCRSWPETPE